MHSTGTSARGSAAQAAAATTLTSMDWHGFTGPGPSWTRTLERQEAEAERRIVRAVQEARDGAALREVEPGWVRFLRHEMPVAAFAFQTAGQLLEQAAGDCPFGPVSQGLSLQASVQVRQAQAIVLYAMDMEQRFGDMPIEGARLRWEAEPEWKLARAFTQQLRGAGWGKIFVGVNLCFEPLVGQLLRREVAMLAGERHGDPVTTVVARAGQEEWLLTRTWTLSLIDFLCGDATHGETNRALLQRWLDELRPAAVAACDTLATMGDRLPRPAPRGDSVAHVVHDQERLLEESGLAYSPAADVGQPR